MSFPNGFAGAIGTTGGRACVVQISTWGWTSAPERLAARHAGTRRSRCRVERIFGTRKRSYGLRRMGRYGLAKAALQVRLTAAASDLNRAAAVLRVARSGAESARRIQERALEERGGRNQSRRPRRSTRGDQTEADAAPRARRS